MIRFTGKVRFDITPAIVLAIVIVDQVYKDLDIDDCWITSANDSVHGPTTLHRKGQAVDFRLHNVPVLVRSSLVGAVKSRLEPQYEVYHESVSTPNEHLHVEWDPKLTPEAL